MGRRGDTAMPTIPGVFAPRPRVSAVQKGKGWNLRYSTGVTTP
jgi:hypothetical protein